MALRVLRLRKFWIALVLAAAAVAIAMLGHRIATRTAFDEAASRGQTTLRLAVAALRGHISRFEPLPALIADHDDIKDLVSHPDDPVRRAQANEYLKEINTLLQSSDIYVMVPNGDTIAASNYDLPLTFVGENFIYRPYFQEAAAGRRGRFFAIGTTSLRRGYFFSSPVLVGDEIRGVVVFKVEIDAVEASWRGGENEIIVADPEGIIFMAGREQWLYAGLLPLTPERVARTRQSRRYADAVLRELPITRGAPEDGHEFVTIRDGGATREFLQVSENMADAGWTVSVLMDTASARAQALTSATAAVLLFGLATLIGAIILQRRARQAERMLMQKQAREELERRVEERTADLATVNAQLELEVAERRTTEQRLRQTQSDLVQAGKLAALGQMSAALSHEFNQPLAAVKAYADNAAVLIDRARVPEARDNVSRISSLADRMATISRHLRNFARKPNQRLGPVPLAEVVDDTLEIIGRRLESAGATLEVDLGAVPPVVIAGTVRLQQVLVNIVSNAADAVQGLDDRTITLTARQQGGKVTIAIRDRGPGIAPQITERIFDPFFSTKGVGKGLGLGLSISYNIVKDFGGSLSAENHPEDGAVFTIELDAAASAAAVAAE
ncbi:ATP-binding protein [Kumtagia ephedrae]|uniref:C4-dicarboxylate transport sensor protein DctB n=1 Tax=Kumtagia ephedrae TaxID=2116701 RepID=A0A2P7SPV0_9HYPH|nr:ATP-binding protein [Mesorhizobium ephedrae]PSJ64477.1 two-component sensor histidine kinase [Mesorhizobium ephedrae]